MLPYIQWLQNWIWNQYEDRPFDKEPSKRSDVWIARGILLMLGEFFTKENSGFTEEQKTRLYATKNYIPKAVRSAIRNQCVTILQTEEYKEARSILIRKYGLDYVKLIDKEVK